LFLEGIVTEEKHEAFRQWCIVDVMGHKRLAGFVTEQVIAGHAFVRVDVFPGNAEKPTSTPLYNPSSLYGITPVTEDVARTFAMGCRADPVAEWEMPRLASGIHDGSEG
jgi:hypothetical protein